MVAVSLKKKKNLAKCHTAPWIEQPTSHVYVFESLDTIASVDQTVIIPATTALGTAIDVISHKSNLPIYRTP